MYLVKLQVRMIRKVRQLPRAAVSFFHSVAIGSSETACSPVATDPSVIVIGDDQELPSSCVAVDV